ncbi:MAG: ubiquinone biosynthesis regulatory protein kinase UbiB [Gammaproteobacteria bacterium RIFCSPHIGHO2_12_FULL_45_9]|nr:MAG: ubiquinone biosynthesis regulatory protein kinase UbiB [Gammaproteobacteria bacterium RIFCSPHIGHO2_12_FULL_45_9]
MKWVWQWVRLIQINVVLARYALTRPVVGDRSVLRGLVYLNPWQHADACTSRGDAIRRALERLGPLFVKFGQMLSTRRDLLPDDLVNELSKLQDQVPPFASEAAVQQIEKAFGKSIHQLFQTFQHEPLASASVAQVHAATLLDGSDVVVKIIRPHIEKTITRDINLLYTGARWVQRFWKGARRLKPVALVAEFARTLLDELDLSREAANASQLKRNFADSRIMYVPKIYWDFVHPRVMVMERIYGIRISDVDALRAANTDLATLSKNGVEIFFTQVLRDSFFHADMHPGNIFVDIKDPRNPRYLGIDFGIMGTLSPFDQDYLAKNLLAFFKRDYRAVAVLHVECGWVPPTTRIDHFEAAVRAVSEPIFERPLRDISFGHLLLRLFRTAERFDMVIQPQLILLQKTLLHIEGLGKALYPDLDLWTTAKPFLEKWMRERQGLRRWMRSVSQEGGEWLARLWKMPELATRVLGEIQYQQQLAHFREERVDSSMVRMPVRRVHRLGWWFLGVMMGMVGCWGLLVWVGGRMLP